MLRTVATVVLLVSALGGSGCDRDAGNEQEQTASTGGEPDVRSPQTDDAEAEADTRSDEQLLAPRDVRLGEGGATLGPDGGTIVAGDCRLEVPGRALDSPAVIQIGCTAVDSIDHELPRGRILAAGHSNPENLGLNRVAKFFVPLQFDIPDAYRETEFELLSWHDGLGAWLTASYGYLVEDSDTVRFLTDHIGPFIVRARPRWSEQRKQQCDVRTLNLGESIPADEGATVGVTKLGEKLSRSQAFARLTDVRTLSLPDHLAFKNEEEEDRHGRVHADERNHRDEDYLMEPSVAEDLMRLTDLVEAEWRTVFTDEPGYDLRVTEAYDSLGEHRDVSTHYQGRALDLTLNPVPKATLRIRRAFYGRLTSLSHCAGFDYSYFENRYHVHVSNRASRLAMLVERKDSGERHLVLDSLAHPDALRVVNVKIPESAVALRWSTNERLELLDDDGRTVLSIEPESGQLLGSLDGESGGEKSSDTLRILGNRTIELVDGTPFLTYANGRFSPGTRDADGTELYFESPLQLFNPDQRDRVIDFAFRQR
jgi:hypothetical protein